MPLYDAQIVLGLKATVIVCADPRGRNALLLCLVNHPLTLGSNLSSFLLSLPFSPFLPSSLPSFLPIFQQDIYRCLLYKGIPRDKRGLILYGVSRLAERNPYPPGNVPEILQAS